ncbi:MAG: hypothetical protein AMXMBFR47_36510 [Planctomycetota bacterium]
MTPVPLNNLAVITMGTAPPGETYNSDGDGMPMIAGAGDYGDIHPIPKKFTTSPLAVAEPGDLIICVRATIGDLNWADRQYCLGRGVAGIRPRNGHADIRYLSHAIESNKTWLASRGTGSTFPAIRKADLEEMPVPLPYPHDPKRSLAEQKRIAAILDKTDAIRRRRHEAARLTDQLIPSLFYGMFGKWLRMPQTEMARLGEKELTDIASGVTKGRRFNGQDTVVVPYIRVANVQDGYLDLTEIKTIDVLPQDVEALRLEHGDVLMTEGGDFDKLGRGAIWEHDVPDCIHQNHVFRVRCNRRKLMPLFFANYIRTTGARAYFLRCAKKTSNLASINMTQLRALPVPRVPIDDQKRFVTKADEVRKMQRRDKISMREVDDLFNSLVQRAFRGEL